LNDLREKYKKVGLSFVRLHNLIFIIITMMSNMQKTVKVYHPRRIKVSH